VKNTNSDPILEELMEIQNRTFRLMRQLNEDQQRQCSEITRLVGALYKRFSD